LGLVGCDCDCAKAMPLSKDSAAIIFINVLIKNPVKNVLKKFVYKNLC
jgi:hypothetical protein